MGFKDFLKRGSGLELVSGDESKDDSRPSGVGAKQAKQKKSNSNSFDGTGIKPDDKVLRQLEIEVSRAIEKLEDLRDKLRVRRGF